jgi:hypothetical protein
MSNNNLFIELGAGLSLGKPIRNIIQAYSSKGIEAFRREQGNIDVFTSVFKYDKEDIRQAKQSGPLYFDLDHQEFALADLRALVEFLTEQGCPKESIRVFYSGFKGFHLEVLFEALSVEADQQLNKVYEVIVKTIKQEIHASSIDTGIYDKVRLWRLPNSINPKSGLYKIPLTLDELSLSLNEIKERAKNPRSDLIFKNPLQWVEFTTIFQKSKRQALKTKRNGIFEPVGEGRRNDVTFKRALKLKSEGKSFEEAFEICCEVEDEPQLSEDEIKRTVASAYQDKYGVENKQENSESQALQVVNLVQENQGILFSDQHNVAFVAPNGDGSQIFRIGSRLCNSWLTNLYWKEKQQVLGPSTLVSISQLLETKALFEGQQFPLYIRTAEFEDSIYYDLGDGRAVKINSQAYEITDSPPILFRRFPHQKKQITPQKGDIKELLNFVNLNYHPDGSLSHDQLLLLCWVVFSFIPDLPHPAPILAGPQGSNKSTFQKALKELIDPSSVQAQASPSSLNEFIQIASHHWFLVLDNLSHLSEWLSDAICRVITGGGFTKRELYSDDSDVIYDFKHIIGLNGINLVVEKADLLDRSLIFNLKRSKQFTKEETFWAKFEERKPYILGGVFEILVKTLNIIKTLPEPEDNFRMADFAHWGSAIAQALGFKAQDFIEAYKANVSKQNQEALDASPVGIALIEFMSDKDEWIGTATDLLNEFEKLADPLHININSKLWPKDARWVWRRITDILPNLEAEKIKATQSRDKQRFITLKKTSEDQLASKSELLIEPITHHPDITDNNDIILGKEIESELPF